MKKITEIFGCLKKTRGSHVIDPNIIHILDIYQIMIIPIKSYYQSYSVKQYKNAAYWTRQHALKNIVYIVYGFHFFYLGGL